MSKQANRYFFFFLICFWGLTVPTSFAQTIEQAYGLRFQANYKHFHRVLPYVFSIDSTQVTDDGFHPLRLRNANKALKVDNLLLWSRTIVLPVNMN